MNNLESLDRWVMNIRREFHRNPELSYHEYGTQAMIISILKELGIDCRKIADTGVVGDIRGSKNGPCIAIRSDIDALAVSESLTELNEDYISRNPGVMHACGHDGHMAIVLGVARLIKENQDDICGSVRFIFQPAEEIPPGGAVRVIEEGGLEDVDAIIGLHIFGDVDIGAINIREGPFMASSNRFTVKIFGKGGHHSTPELCIDPVHIAAEFISALNPAVSRKIDPSEYVLGFGSVKSGEQFNRTPDEIEIVGSFRTFADEDIINIEQIMSSILDYLMNSYSGPNYDNIPYYDLDVQHGYPVLYNYPVFTNTASRLLKSKFPVVNNYADRTFGAEDFAYYLREVPGMYAIIGTRNEDKGIVDGNHSSEFDIDEDVLLSGIELLHCIALDFLKNPGEYLE